MGRGEDGSGLNPACSPSSVSQNIVSFCFCIILMTAFVIFTVLQILRLYYAVVD